MTVKSVLLSSSFPSGARGEEVRPFDVAQIADACVHVSRALLRAQKTIVFGAHPTISPLLLSLAAERGIVDQISIHQTRWFQHEIPKDTRRFQEMGFGAITWTEAGDDRESSLTVMRTKMVSEVQAAVFIGGMSGIDEEAEMVSRVRMPAFAVSGPGGEARKLTARYGFEDLDGPKYPEIAATIVESIGDGSKHERED